MSVKTPIAHDFELDYRSGLEANFKSYRLTTLANASADCAEKQENGYILLMCLCKFIGAMCGAISVYEGMEEITSGLAVMALIWHSELQLDAHLTQTSNTYTTKPTYYH